MNKARILIVDDGTAGAGDLGEQLVELGYEPVGHTTRGAEAILLAGQLRPDLVLMDISLAGEMNSLAAAQAIHDQFALPVVFLTRFVAEEVMDHAQLAEPFGYLSKPFDRGKLRMVIEMAIYKQSVERQYQARGEWHRSILQKAMDGFWLTDPQGRLLEVNETYCQMSGYSAPELLAMRISDLEAVETAAVTALRIQKIMAQGADRFESRHRRKDGSLFEVEVSVQYQPANGRRLVVFLRDITARKQAEESLRLDNQIMAHMADGVYLIRERDGVIVYTNDRFEKMFGYAPGELLGQPGAVVNAPTPQPPEVTAQAIIAELGRTGVWEGEIQNRKKDGSTFWCQARVSTFVHGSYGPVWVALHQDITSRKLAEEELRVHQMEVLTQNEELRRSQMELDASRARYFDLFDLAPVGYVTIGKRGLILENNLTAARLLGVARGALIRKPFSRFIFKEDSDSYLQLRKQLFDTSAPQTCDLRMVRSDGPPFWVHLAATAAQDAAGAPVCRVTLSDITARKLAEEALQSSLREKVALLNEVHHRVKNNLHVITSLLRLVEGRSEHPATKSVLQEMSVRILAIALLHESLYRSGTFASVDLGAYLRKLTDQSFSAQVVRPDSIRFQLDLASVQIEMDQAMPCGLLVNELVSNSLKHGFPGDRSGEVRVELQPIDGGPQFRLRVSDTGVGLPADFESKQGKSLGLKLVSNLVQQIGGRLEIGSGPGAVFEVIFLPKHSKSEPSNLPASRLDGRSTR